MSELQTFDNLMERLKKAHEASMIRREAEALKKKIVSEAKVKTKPEQQVFSFFPTKMMRVSIFFPINKKDLDLEKRRITKEVHEHSWGKLEVAGVRLGIIHEDFLINLFAQQNKSIVIGGGKISYKLNDLARYKTKKKHGANEKDKDRVKGYLDDFQLCKFKILTNNGDEHSIGSIVSSWKYIKATDKVEITFNHLFLDLFGENLITYINVNERKQLTSDGAKALYRFISTHDQPTPMHMLTIMRGLNWDVNQTPSALWKCLNRAIKELVKRGHLDKKSKVTKAPHYIVTLIYPSSKGAVKRRGSITNNTKRK